MNINTYPPRTLTPILPVNPDRLLYRHFPFDKKRILPDLFVSVMGCWVSVLGCSCFLVNRRQHSKTDTQNENHYFKSLLQGEGLNWCILPCSRTLHSYILFRTQIKNAWFWLEFKQCAFVLELPPNPCFRVVGFQSSSESSVTLNI